tara:strand:- start:40 stop:1932 length:1893 start_codon:yes stop_codon:yes gene_type:complete
MAQLDVTELDFANIKQSLKTFMQAQDEFSDYDFEGSALSVLLDTLAYNTHYNAVMAHMLANESFLDSAIKRSSVVSIAKSLGYTPRSRRASTSILDFSITPSPSYTDSTYTLPRTTPFSVNVNNATYNFYPAEDVTATLQTVNGTDQFVFASLEIKEGTRVSNNYLIDSNTISGPLTISNTNIDTTTIRVRIQKSTTDLTLETFLESSSLLDLTSTSRAYFVEEGIDSSYVIRFGDDVFGKKLEVGNIVTIEYLVSSSTAANGAKAFGVGPTLTGSSEVQSFANVTAAVGGAEKESIDSIRRTAPLYNQTRERAVSASDYRSLILADNPNVQSVAVWGGENNDPPIYGKVFISLDPVPGQIITEVSKDKISTSLISPRAPVAILPVFIDPVYTYIGLKVGIVYDPSVTALTSGQISGAASTAINSYFNTDLNQLNKNFYYSRIHNEVKAVSPSIISVNITPTLQKRLTVEINIEANYTFSFNSRIQPRELHSNWFNTVTHKVKFQDIPSATVVPPAYNGTGTVHLQTEDGTNIATVGTIDYDTGKLTLTSIKVASLYSTDTELKLRTRPHDDSKDIVTSTLNRTSDVSTGAVIAKPAQNTILSLDDSVLSSVTGARKGLDITVTTEVEGY